MKPILFNTDMVQAILQNRKTVTRRIAFPNGDLQECMSRDNQAGWIFRGRLYENWDSAMKAKQGPMSLCRFRPGDVLYVRETWKQATGDPAGGGHALFDTYVYKADGKAKDDYPLDGLMIEDRWHPSIHIKKITVTLLRENGEEETVEYGDFFDANVQVEFRMHGLKLVPAKCEMKFNYDPPETDASEDREARNE